MFQSGGVAEKMYSSQQCVSVSAVEKRFASKNFYAFFFFFLSPVETGNIFILYILIGISELNHFNL